MTRRADVSVLIACRNAASTLVEALESVHRQTLPVREILIGDDASTDDTARLMESLSYPGLDIRCLRSETNIGPASMRNKLLAQARCGWVAILDADDTWKLDRMEKLWALSTDADVVSDDLIFWIDGIRENGSVCATHNFRSDNECRVRLEDMLCHDLGLLHPLMRRQFLLDHRIQYRDGMFHAEDLDLYVRLLIAGAVWKHSPLLGYLYRRHATSLTKNWREGVVRSRESLERIRQMEGIREAPRLTRMVDHWISVKNDLEIVYAVRDDFREAKFAKAFLRAFRTSAWSAMFRLSRAWKQ